LVGGLGHGGQEGLHRLGEVDLDAEVVEEVVRSLLVFLFVAFLDDQFAGFGNRDLDLEGLVALFLVLLVLFAELLEGFAGDSDQG
jgi:hypothetical protein